MPTVWDVGLAVPTLQVPRAWPCQAKGIGPYAVLCGATPASLWRRSCPAGHFALVRLCGLHASFVMALAGACADCMRRGYAAPAVLAPVDLILLGHAGGQQPRAAPVLMRRAA